MVCRSVTVVSHAKKPELIEMLLGLLILVGPVNHVIDGVQVPHPKGQFWGKEAVHCKV